MDIKRITNDGLTFCTTQDIDALSSFAASLRNEHTLRIPRKNAPPAKLLTTPAPLPAFSHQLGRVHDGTGGRWPVGGHRGRLYRLALLRRQLLRSLHEIPSSDRRVSRSAPVGRRDATRRGDPCDAAGRASCRGAHT